MNRGDVVIVPFPFQDKLGQKIRPAVVVQSDAENRRLANTVLAIITGNLDDAGQPTCVLVDTNTPDGAGSGLSGPSLVKCYKQMVDFRLLWHALPSPLCLVVFYPIRRNDSHLS